MMKNDSLKLYMALFLLFCFRIYPENSGQVSQFLIGNGRLLAGVEKDGTLSFARWPHIGGNNHIGIGEFSIGQGNEKRLFLEPTAFLLQAGESLYSLTHLPDTPIEGKYIEPDIPLFVLRGAMKDTPITWEQEVFVCPDRDVIYIHFTIHSPKDIAKYFVSFQNISPKPLPIPENPMLHIPADIQTDFAVFWDDTLKTVIHFRPYKAGMSDTYRLQQINEMKNISPRFWRKFEEGAYIGILSLNPVVSAHIGDVDSDPTVFLSQHDFPKTIYTFKDFCSSLFVQPLNTGADTEEITICYIFADTYSKMEEEVQRIRTQDYAQVKEAFLSYWRTQWETTRKTIKTEDMNTRLYLTLCSDSKTGAILTQPFDPVEGNRISLQDSFYLMQSLNNMNLMDFSRKLLLFWHNIGKERKSEGKQTFPLWVYPDGISACPDYWADITQTAYFICMVSALEKNLNFSEKKEVLSEIWDVLVWGIDNLCLWKVPGDLLPAPSFNVLLNRDVQTADTLIQTLIGIQQGIQLAKLLFKPVPELWKTRENELQTWIRLAILNENVLEIFPSKDLSFWKQIFPENNILWQLPVKYKGNKMLLKDIK